MTDEEIYQEMMRQQAQQRRPQPESKPQPRSQPQEEPRYPVRSEPMRSGKKDSAIFSRSQLRHQRGSIEKTTAVIVWLLSLLGTVVAFHGGWDIMLKQLIPAALIGGVLIQVIVTSLEWYWYDNPWISWSARILDTYLTALGFGPLLVPWLLVQLTARAVPQPEYSAWAVVIVLSYLIAWYPESRLVD